MSGHVQLLTSTLQKGTINIHRCLQPTQTNEITRRRRDEEERREGNRKMTF